MMNLKKPTLARAVGIAVALILYGSALPSAQATSVSPTSVDGAAALYSQGGNTDFIGSISPPKSARELLSNIKWAVDNNVFLSGEVFTEGNIHRLLGKHPLHWAPETPAQKYVTIDEKADADAHAVAERGCVRAAVLSWVMKSDSRLPKVQVAIGIRWSEPECATFSADAVRAAFGEPNSITSVFPTFGPPNPHRQLVPMRTVHPWGNTDVQYRLRKGATVTELKMEVLGNGVIREFRVLSEEF